MASRGRSCSLGKIIACWGGAKLRCLLGNSRASLGLISLEKVSVFFMTPDAFRGVLLASKEVRAEVLAHVEVVNL